MKKVSYVLFLFILIFGSYFALEKELKFIKIKVEKVEGSVLKGRFDNKSIELKLAPTWYLIENGYVFVKGDELQVKYISNKNVNTVTEIIKGKKTMKFIDEKGEFLWKRGGITGGSGTKQSIILKGKITK